MKKTSREIRRIAFACIARNRKSSYFNEFFIAHNDKLQKFLENHALITPESAITEFDCFRARYCWRSEKFVVSP